MGPEGRPLHLLPVTWGTDGFPILGVQPINGAGQFTWNGGTLPCSGTTSTTPKSYPQGSDDFNSNVLSPRWTFSYQPRAGFWSLTEKPGFLRLKAFKQLQAGNFHKTGNMLTQKYFRSNSIRLTTKISIASFATGQVGGMAHWAANHGYSFIAVSIPAGSTTPQLLWSQTGATDVTATIPKGTVNVWFRSVADYAGTQTFSYSFDGVTFKGLGSSYTLAYYQYRGSMINLFTYNNVAETGAMDVDSFEYCFDHGWGLQCP